MGGGELLSCSTSLHEALGGGITTIIGEGGWLVVGVLVAMLMLSRVGSADLMMFFSVINEFKPLVLHCSIVEVALTQNSFVMEQQVPIYFEAIVASTRQHDNDVVP